MSYYRINTVFTSFSLQDFEVNKIIAKFSICYSGNGSKHCWRPKQFYTSYKCTPNEGISSAFACLIF